MSVLETFNDYYNRNDHRSSELFLVSRPGTLIAIVSLYLYFSVSLGPRYMRNRKPYTLRTTLILYNFIQVLVSMMLFCEGLMLGWLFEYSWTCQPMDFSDSPSAMRIVRAGHMYFVCKIIELLDTVFFVLRKKNRQISVLHLYHHVFMPLATWCGVRYYPATGQGSLFAVLNSFVHIIMYSYYLLAALGPEVQKYLWWKKYLTLLQLLQFLIVVVHSAQTLFNGCDYPKSMSLSYIGLSSIFIYMFGSFYIKNYMTKKVHTADSDNTLTDSRKCGKSD